MHTNPHLISLLKQWLNNYPSSNYMEGVNLFYDLTGKVNTKNSLIQFRAPEKLKGLMDNLYKNLQEQNLVVDEKAEADASKANATEVKLDDKIIARLSDKIILLYKEMNIEHAKLLEQASSTERLKIAKKVVGIDMHIRSVQDELVYYREHGQLPTKTALPKTAMLSENDAALKLKLRTMPQANRQDKKALETLRKMLEEAKQAHNLKKIELIMKRIEKTEKRLADRATEKLRIINILNDATR